MALFITPKVEVPFEKERILAEIKELLAKDHPDCHLIAGFDCDILLTKRVEVMEEITRGQHYKRIVPTYYNLVFGFDVLDPALEVDHAKAEKLANCISGYCVVDNAKKLSNILKKSYTAS